MAPKEHLQPPKRFAASARSINYGAPPAGAFAGSMRGSRIGRSPLRSLHIRLAVSRMYCSIREVSDCIPSALA
ncbi:hypothetical protein MCEL_03430 [Mycolicibacterium celeriflavum]|uniref:Uncharacterized protein n=1 Tax=Mycolicibacterium celeriflavum TaxID=1249101 RepID=A0A7I7RBY8_MYCCF|nr:hypothetical protein MCEL_03430 [Mycolicibacterium celeriflavum]